MMFTHLTSDQTVSNNRNKYERKEMLEYYEEFIID